MNIGVLTAFPASFTSVVWRIASMAEILDAFIAGKYVEMKIVSIETTQAIKSDSGVTMTVNFSVIPNALEAWN